MVVLICNSMETNNIEQFFMCLLALHLSLLLGTVCKSYACSLIRLSSYCCCSVAKSCPALCNHMNCTMPGFPVLHYLPELAQTHVHWVNHPTISSSVTPFSSLPSIFSSIRIFSSESALCIRWPKYWSFSTSLSNEYSGLISFRIDWFDPCTLPTKPFGLSRVFSLQHHTCKASIPWCSAFFTVQLSHPYMTMGLLIKLFFTCSGDKSSVWSMYAVCAVLS